LLLAQRLFAENLPDQVIELTIVGAFKTKTSGRLLSIVICFCFSIEEILHKNLIEY